MNIQTDSVLSVRNLKLHYPVRSALFGFGEVETVKAVDGVDLDLKAGETLGVVGESGCGKSSLGKAIMRLHEPTSGEVTIEGKDFLAPRGDELRKARKTVQMVFQDPYASLNPRMTVLDILSEPIKAHYKLQPSEISERVKKVMDMANLPFRAIRKYPHEFSGGQRQRIAIARALTLKPKIIIADEPVSSLDVSIQAQILNLFKEIQKELGLSLIFIAHNLAVVKYISDRVAVMYLGKFVEVASREDLYREPKHPYTKALVSAVPIPDPDTEERRERIRIPGELPSPINPPAGCSFHTRCPLARKRCIDREPELQTHENPKHWVSCWEVVDPTSDDQQNPKVR